MTDIELAREYIAKRAEADREMTFAREVRAGAWDHRHDVQWTLQNKSWELITIGKLVVRPEIVRAKNITFHLGDADMLALTCYGEIDGNRTLLGWDQQQPSPKRDREKSQRLRLIGVMHSAHKAMRAKGFDLADTRHDLEEIARGFA